MSEVTSVNGKTGAVTLAASDVGAVPTSEVGQPNGVASLNSGGKLPEAQLPSSVVASSQGNFIPLKQYDPKWEPGHDSTKALEEAIAASVAAGGVPILLPAGEGEINGEPKLPKNLSCRIVIRGAGRGNTIVKLTSAPYLLSYVKTVAGDTIGDVDLSDFTINGNNVTGGGSVILEQSNECREQVNVVNVRVRRVNVINVPGPATSANRHALLIQSYQSFPNQALNKIENIDIGEVEIEGCQGGVTIMGESTQTPFPINVRMRHILIEDVLHEVASTAIEDHNCANVQVGQNAWTDQPETIVVRRIRGVNSSDVGVELDVPCVFDQLSVTNAYNEGLLLNTFNPAATGSPVVTKTAAVVKSGESLIKVASSANFVVGRQIVFYASGVASCECRTIKAIPGSEHIEVTEALSTEWAESKWISQVDDMDAIAWKGGTVTIYHTTTMTNGNNRGIVFQNAQNVIPCSGISIANPTVIDTSTGHATQVFCQTGTSKSASGSPRFIKLGNLKVDKKNLEYGESSTLIYSPVSFEMKAPAPPIEIKAEISVEGNGNTGSGKIQGRCLNFSSTRAILDLDVVTRWRTKTNGTEKVYGIGLNQATVGDLRGRVRHRWLPSRIEEGGGALVGIAFGKGCAFSSQGDALTSSQSPLTKLTSAAVAEALVLEVESTEGFAEGQAIVVDSLSTAKAEIYLISSVNEAEKKITVCKSGNKPGMAAEHAIGAAVSLLRSMVVEDCDSTALNSTGPSLEFEDGKVAVRAMTRGYQFTTPEAPEVITPPETTKVFWGAYKGRSGVISVIGGTVTLVESSPNGKSFYKVAGGTNVQFHVSPGDFWTITYSSAPTVTFIPDRV